MPSLMDLTALLPIDRARGALLPPVRLLREATVIAARTTRHWELMLAGEDPSERGRGLDPDVLGRPGSTSAGGVEQTSSSWGRRDDESASSAQTRASSRQSRAEGGDPDGRSGSLSGSEQVEVVDLRDLSGDDLPVEGWPSMSLADAQASLSPLSPAQLAALLAYEQAHGHRIAFEQMLQHRLERSGAVLAEQLPD